jgi:hypothetical protein
MVSAKVGFSVSVIVRNSFSANVDNIVSVSVSVSVSISVSVSTNVRQCLSLFQNQVT